MLRAIEVIQEKPDRQTDTEVLFAKDSDSEPDPRRGGFFSGTVDGELGHIEAETHHRSLLQPC